VDGVRLWATRTRLATVSGDLRTVGVPQYLLAPASICDTNDEVQFLRMSRKKASSWLQIPDKYESMDLGLMKKL
jgi:hypothetical protein